MKTGNFSLIILGITTGLFLLPACSPKSVSGNADANSNSVTLGMTPPPAINPTTTPIIVTPANANIGTFQSLQLQVKGGIPPYRFQKLSGTGTVGYTNGVFSSTGVASTVEILVSDSAGASTSVSILVAGGSQTSTSVSGGVTNCSTMLSAPNVALMDNSSSGLAYGTAVNLADPTSCGNWCGSVGASYCMWSPGSNSSPVCIGWPAATSMVSYMSSWATYSGACQ